jgi:hypothetical protein
VLDDVSDGGLGLCHKGDGLLKHAGLLKLVVLLGSNLQWQDKTIELSFLKT